MNVTGIGRTNFFRVVNDVKFKAEMERYDVEVAEQAIDGHMHYAIIDENSGGLWPSDVENAEQELQNVYFPDVVAKHLVDGEIAVFMAISNEGARSIIGNAMAINNRRERVSVTLDDIYLRAAARFGHVPRPATNLPS